MDSLLYGALAALLLMPDRAPTPHADDPGVVMELRHGDAVIAATRAELSGIGIAEDPVPSVTFTLADEAARAFGEMTAGAIGGTIGLYVCGRLVIEPIVWTPILGGKGVVGTGDLAEAERIAAILRGEAPCP